MTYIMVDVEADGPCPGLYSMIEVGAVNCDDLTHKFEAKLTPITDIWQPEALKSIGRTREETFNADNPLIVMAAFASFLSQFNQPMFISDNNGFDWQFVNYYFWKFLGRNPFGHSSTNLNSLYKGYVKNTRKNCKHLRKTKHTHNAIDDAMGNVEAFNTFRKSIGA